MQQICFHLPTHTAETTRHNNRLQHHIQTYSQLLAPSNVHRLGGFRKHAEETNIQRTIKDGIQLSLPPSLNLLHYDIRRTGLIPPSVRTRHLTYYHSYIPHPSRNIPRYRDPNTLRIISVASGYDNGVHNRYETSTIYYITMVGLST